MRRKIRGAIVWGGFGAEDCLCQVLGICENGDLCALYGIDCGGDPTIEEQLEEFDDNITDSLENDCLKDVLNNIKDLQGGKIGEIIFKLSQDIPSWDWTLFDNGTVHGAVAETYSFGSNGAATFFEFDIMKNYTELAIARTMLHEGVHAYLVNYFYNDPSAASMSYPQLFEYFINGTDTALAHHIMMGDSLVNDIASALQNYGQSHGYNLPSQVYKDMAWGGLYGQSIGVPAFNALSPSEKERIRNRNAAENSSNTRDDQTPSGGKKCN